MQLASSLESRLTTPATVRPARLPAAESFIPRPIEQVFDEQRRLLADARLVVEGTRLGMWRLEPLSPTPLLDYYFGRGRQTVWLGAHDRAVSARLATSWRDGRRVWHVEIDRSPLAT